MSTERHDNANITLQCNDIILGLARGFWFFPFFLKKKKNKRCTSIIISFLIIANEKSEESQITVYVSLSLYSLVITVRALEIYSNKQYYIHVFIHKPGHSRCIRRIQTRLAVF